MSEDSSSDASSVFCGADLDDRFARHAQRALEAETFENPSEQPLVSAGEVERFFRAVEDANKQLVLEIIKTNPTIVNSRSLRRHKSTPLHIAAENELVEIIAILLAAQANPELVNEFGLNALSLCPPDGDAFRLISDVTELKENGRRDAVLRGGDVFYRF